jgi:hypothetical protein
MLLPVVGPTYQDYSPIEPGVLRLPRERDETFDVVVRLDASVKGGGRLTASGTVGEIVLTIDGGSDADLADLAATRIHVTLAGGAHATINARDLVDGSASGGARLWVRGGPSVDVVTSGGAEVAAD